MAHKMISRFICVVAAITAITVHAHAQYDRDGRYVPSPGGVPRDPYAQPIPGYSGTPGAAIGTPSLPRSLYPPPSPPRSTFPSPRPADPLIVYPSSRPLSLEQCRDGWSQSTRVTKVEFRRRCTLMERAEERKRGS